MDQTVDIPEAWQAFTPEQRAILIALPQSPSLTAAARTIGIHRDTAYGWAERDPAFADALRRAKEEHADNLEAELYRRAMSGEGQMPDTLGIFMLKGYRPMFRESATLNVRQDIRITHSIAELSPDDRIALLQLALQEETPLLEEGVIDVGAVAQPE